MKKFESTEWFKKYFYFFKEHISDDKYLKLYRVDSNLVDYNTDTLKNTLEFTSENEDMFLRFDASVYETLNKTDSDRYEYIYPEISFNKNLISSPELGTIDLQSNFKVSKYNTNQYSNFLQMILIGRVTN